jgi:hypothetical protein
MLALVSGCRTLPMPTESRAQDYSYTTNNGTVAITQYNGDGSDVVIPATIDGKPVTSIGHFAFYDCTSLRSVTIPKSVTHIGESVFARCSHLSSITVDKKNPAYSSANGALFDKKKTRLHEYAGGRTGAYTVPHSVTTIDTFAFYYRTNMTSITIPDSVTNIAHTAFWYCKGVTDVTLGNGVTKLTYELFNEWTSLRSINIPKTVTSIEGGAFYMCTNLTSIAVSKKNPSYSSVDGVLFDKNRTTLVQYATGRAGPYVVPAGVTNIADYAFFNSTRLSSVTIPDSVTNIGRDAFWYCICLTNVSVGSGVVNIGQDAFQACKRLTDITLPSSVSTIGRGAFSGCYSLSGVHFRGNAPTVDRRVFDGCPTTATVYYVKGTAGWGETFGGRAAKEWIPKE